MTPGLPNELLAQALSLRAAGASELAWPRDAALEALRELARPECYEVGVLGGDVWRLCADGPTPAYDNWYCNRLTDELPAAYAVRSRARAEAYVRDYCARFNEVPLFVLVLTERGLVAPR